MTYTLKHTLPPDDVCVLLQATQPRLVSIEEKEELIRQGLSYGELLTPEQVPSRIQTEAFLTALERNGQRMAELLAALTADLLRKYSHPIFVSLARAGTPVGCAMRRLARRWGVDVPHYTLSIIRGSGIDLAALNKITKAHPSAQLIFVDGWTGKGSIFTTLKESLPHYVPLRLAVLSDPAGVAQHAATFDDVLLPHAALNATVCGLLSRTVLTGKDQLHGSRIEEQLSQHDLSQKYLETLDLLCEGLSRSQVLGPGQRPKEPQAQALALAAQLGVTDPHLVKPSVGEATRVFLRRSPAHLILRDLQHPDTQHLRHLAAAAKVPVTVSHQLSYLAVALIQPSPLSTPPHQEQKK